MATDLSKFDLMTLADPSFNALCLNLVKRSLAKIGATVEMMGQTGLEIMATLPSGERWGLAVQNCRDLGAKKEKTFEKDDQEIIELGCTRLHLIPAYAFAFVTKEEPRKVQVLLGKVNSLVLTAKEKLTFLSLSKDKGIVFHLSPAALKDLKANPHIIYSSYVL
jgi:hypothetical protein